MSFKKWDKRVLTVLMQWEHGHKDRGFSPDVQWFYSNFKELCSEAIPFWYDEYFADLDRLQRELLRKAEAVNPDLIFFLPYTGQVYPETLDILKSRWKTCAWFGDDSWRFDDYSSKMAPHYTYAATTDPFCVSKYRKLGVKPILTQWAAQIRGGGAGPLSPASYKYDVSFLGGYNKYRAWFIERLAALGVRVNAFGPGWPAGKVSFEEMDTIFRNSRVNLNLSNSINQDIRFVLSNFRNLATYMRSPKRAEQIKARNFEIPLAGGFQLTNYVVGLEKYFKIGEEVAVYTSPEDCALQVSYYLENQVEREKILEAGYQRAVREHTYPHRLERILEEIWG